MIVITYALPTTLLDHVEQLVTRLNGETGWSKRNLLLLQICGPDRHVPDCLYMLDTKNAQGHYNYALTKSYRLLLLHRQAV